MIDLSKIPSNALFTAIAILSLSALTIGWISYSRNEPFMLNGKEFGFGSNELEKRTTQLLQCQDEATKSLTQAKQTLASLAAENEQLKAANASLTAEQRARAVHENAMWFPVDDVSFADNGTFTTGEGEKRRRGKWSSDDSELSLQLVERNGREIVLATNLPAPGNKIRMTVENGVFVPMSKWEYKLSVIDIGAYAEATSIRIERRQKRS